MRLDAAHTVASAVAPSLDKSLWQTRLCAQRSFVVFRCRSVQAVRKSAPHPGAPSRRTSGQCLGSFSCVSCDTPAVLAQVPEASAKAVVRVAARPDDAGTASALCMVHDSTQRGSFSPAAMCCKSWLLSQMALQLQSCSEEALVVDKGLPEPSGGASDGSHG